ncbi:DUF2116 family Zn-ribbon domain-containing protein [Ralstonia insidiosa]|uniref:DUF2116 family Zn-ribbon domain-containing protein n=1 Tax=Ralstonia insidiosa TaxID=190721 RepID=A0A848NW93_9RALS|nr:DUF2116 family Zn-ribbon domain-containing protein [Ralstonia insidiosa]NMV36794.1 DUF2116 family Zn-ribbon domain-containing protein [Ralstonia insidiosa]
MADAADIAGYHEETFHAALLTVVRRAAHMPVRRTGACRFCGERISLDRAFCDIDCRDDHEREERIRELSGSRRV